MCARMMLAAMGGVASALVVAVLGHGAMVHPKPRNAIDGVLPFFNEGACAFGPDSEVCELCCTSSSTLRSQKVSKLREAHTACCMRGI